MSRLGATSRCLICGMPRSGTTLAAELLARHADVHVGPETHLLRLARLPRSGIFDRAAAEAALRRVADGSSSSVSPDWIRTVADRLPAVVPIGDLLFELASEGRTDQAVAGEKTPAHLEHAELLMRADAGVRAVVVVRDVRDVVRSLEGVPWSTAGPTEVGVRWGRYAGLALRLERSFAGRVSIVRFEDLVVDADRFRASMEELLDLSPQAWGPTGSPATFDPVTEPWKQRAVGALDRTRASAWRADPRPSDRTLERICGAWLERFGYPVDRGRWSSLAIEGVARRVYGLRRFRQ